MSISQPQYAAQFLDPDSDNYKFDDIGCMLVFVNRKNVGADRVTFFFMNYLKPTEWLDAKKAVFVWSERIHSPMNSHLAAFDGERSAKDFARDNNGRVFTLSELLHADVENLGPAGRPSRP